jgi:uncharacterized protein (TIGR02118 family)
VGAIGLRWSNRMAQMIVVYKTPDDADAFGRHYFGVHVPLAKKLPDLRKYETSVGPITTLGSAADTHFVAVLHFDSVAAIRSPLLRRRGRRAPPTGASSRARKASRRSCSTARSCERETGTESSRSASPWFRVARNWLVFTPRTDHLSWAIYNPSSCRP